jgi:CubicO group peptidase (beta-lactamase class C family)
MNSGDLADALDFARENQVNIHSLTIVRNGFMVLDAYFYPFAPDTRHDLASATKSIVAVLLGRATDDGYFAGPEQSIVSALPAESSAGLDSAASQVRIVDLLSMRSGFDCGFGRGEPELDDMRRAENWTAYALRLPIVAEPGTRFGYCSPNFHLVSAAISSATGQSTLDYAMQRLFDPIGIGDVYWPADPQGINHGWGDLQLRPRDMAKLGLLMLREGRWEENQLIPANWVEGMVTTRVPVNDDEDYGLGWWLSRGDPSLFEANGRGGQRITVVPNLDIVVVMTGGEFEPGDIGGFILRALRSDAALPDNPLGQQRLADSLRSIAEPPLRRAAQQPETASRVSGRIYDLQENTLGVETFSIQFSDAEDARLRLGLGSGEELLQALGLDGTYRLTNVQDGAISAGRADWLDDGRLRIELNRLSLINRFIFEIEFGERDLEIQAFEPTELGNATLRGTWRQ